MSSVRPQTWTVSSILKWASDDFRTRGIDSPRLDAELLLALALECDRIKLIIDAEKPLAPNELARFRELVLRRRAREPIAYITGKREFYGHVFKVDPRVLVPRPDTEALVEVALKFTEERSTARIVDLCTGSGCIAISLAKKRPEATVLATDASEDALTVARENAEALTAPSVTFASGDLFAALAGETPFDLIVSNPPYIAAAEIETLAADIRNHEPRLALDGGADGLSFYRRILEGAAAHLAPGGMLAVEVGMGQAGDVSGLFEIAGFQEIELAKDIQRIDRVVSGKRP